MALAKLMDVGFDEDVHCRAVEDLSGRSLPALSARSSWSGRPHGVLRNHRHPSQILVRGHDAPDGSFEVFVRTPDRDGLFAALVATLDRLGLSVLDARMLNSTDGYASTVFRCRPADGRQTRRRSSTPAGRVAGSGAREAGTARAMPRHLQTFPGSGRESISTPSPDGRRTRLSLVGTDRPGLLADVAQVLRSASLARA